MTDLWTYGVQSLVFKQYYSTRMILMTIILFIIDFFDYDCDNSAV